MKITAARFLMATAILAFLAACSEEQQSAPQEPLTAEEALIQEGQRKTRICTGCHGPAGISRVPTYPSLAGKPQDYLAAQLHAFRSGERDNPTMSSIALNLSDADIAAISHYFSSLPDAPEPQAAKSQ